MSHKKVEGTYRNNPLKMPVYSTNLAMFSFSSISIKIINLFLFKDLFLEKKQLTNFYNNDHNLFNAYSICLASSNSWLLYILQSAVNFLITFLYVFSNDLYVLLVFVRFYSIKLWETFVYL
jgi:hypothetical protein